jgi:hypothetical protein
MSLNFVAILVIFFETIGKNGSFGFAKCRLVFWAKPNVPFVRLAKIVFKNVRWEKIKIQKRWLLGRLSDGSFVQSLYVYFCRSFLFCRLLGLLVTCLYRTKNAH